MSSLRLLALAAALGATALAPPAAAQPAPPDPAAAFLAPFVRDATAITALPWQREPLALSTEQVAALHGIAEGRRPVLSDLYDEIQMLFENAGMLDQPVDAREAYALYADLAAHKLEALMAFHATAEAMLDVLTPTQRAQWEATLADAAQDQRVP